MRVSVSAASFLACLGLSFGLVQAQGDANNNTTQPLVFNPADVVQEIIMGDSSNDQPQLRQVATGATASPWVGIPVTPEIRNAFLESLNVRRPFDELTVTTPDANPIQIIRVKHGKRFVKAIHVKPPPGEDPKKFDYIYGEFMVLRLRSMTNELVQSIRAPPEQAAEQGLTLTHTASNTKVSSQSTTTGWDAQAVVTARVEASAGFRGVSASVSAEVSSTVQRSVATTYESSQESTITMSTEKSFTLSAPPGKVAALWMAKTTIDVYVCKSSTQKTSANPINGNCHFSHTVKEEGKRYEITLSQ